MKASSVQGGWAISSGNWLCPACGETKGGL